MPWSAASSPSSSRRRELELKVEQDGASHERLGFGVRSRRAGSGSAATTERRAASDEPRTSPHRSAPLRALLHVARKEVTGTEVGGDTGLGPGQPRLHRPAQPRGEFVRTSGRVADGVGEPARPRHAGSRRTGTTRHEYEPAQTAPPAATAALAARAFFTQRRKSPQSGVASVEARRAVERGERNRNIAPARQKVAAACSRLQEASGSGERRASVASGTVKIEGAPSCACDFFTHLPQSGVARSAASAADRNTMGRSPRRRAKRSFQIRAIFSMPKFDAAEVAKKFNDEIQAGVATAISAAAGESLVERRPVLVGAGGDDATTFRRLAVQRRRRSDDSEPSRACTLRRFVIARRRYVIRDGRRAFISVRAAAVGAPRARRHRGGGDRGEQGGRLRGGSRLDECIYIIYYPIFGGPIDDYLRDVIGLEKDVEGLNHRYRYSLYHNIPHPRRRCHKKCVLPCTPLAVVKILEGLGAYDRSAPVGSSFDGRHGGRRLQPERGRRPPARRDARQRRRHRLLDRHQRDARVRARARIDLKRPRGAHVAADELDRPPARTTRRAHEALKRAARVAVALVRVAERLTTAGARRRRSQVTGARRLRDGAVPARAVRREGAARSASLSKKRRDRDQPRAARQPRAGGGRRRHARPGDRQGDDRDAAAQPPPPPRQLRPARPSSACRRRCARCRPWALDLDEAEVAFERQARARRTPPACTPPR